MWRRTYFFLFLVRLYFALSPSYLHPDEHFQGPEVISGRVFHHPIHETWEFSSSSPVRSVFSLWPVYGLPMLLLRSLSGAGVSSRSVFTVLRVVMFGLSFVLEDWALHELIPTRRQRRAAILLVASSYVTWSWQVHTFSNAIETVIVLWSLVLIRRLEARLSLAKSPLIGPAVLACLVVFGTFNRITFPAYVVLPLLRLAPKLSTRLSSLAVTLVAAAITTLVAVGTDTIFYSDPAANITSLVRGPTITPLNNLRYNMQSSNLELHGTHPFYQHFLINLPQLLGPAFILLLTGNTRIETPLVSGLFGTFVLSCFSHQEARFLLPVVPLALASVTVPNRYIRGWAMIWIVFNVLFGVLMGVYHQGGVVPMQMHLAKQSNVTQAFWWKTYSPPTWVLGPRSNDLATVDLMGLDKTQLESRICAGSGEGTVLVAPRSAVFLDTFKQGQSQDVGSGLRLVELWSYSQHLNLDDLDIGDDGFVPSVERVIGRRGLAVWKVRCQQTR